jgi:arsenate reductase (thioredoxin)
VTEWIVREAERDEVLPLLREEGLPTEDLTEGSAEFLAVRSDDGQVIGSVGLEFHGSDALIRSLAVAEPHRGSGIGGVLVAAAIDRARAADVNDLYGVTTSAEHYLARYAFSPVERELIPAVLTSSSQLTDVCPNDATVLVRHLRPVVLFMCVHNAGRSQMAAALLKRLAGDAVDVRSAGTDPADSLNISVVQAMREVGIDIAGEQPKLMMFDMAREADVVVTMGCGDSCPAFPGKRYENWELTDPAELSIEAVRPIRDDIERRVKELYAELST